MDTVFFCIPSVVALFWAARIFLSPDSNRVRLFLAAGILMIPLSLLGSQSVAFAFPFVYLAVRTQVAESDLSRWDFLIFLPSALAAPFSGSVFFQVFLVIQVTAISVWAMVRVSRYGRRLAELYDESEVSVEDIRQVLVYAILLSVIVSVLELLPEELMSALLIKAVFTAFITVLVYLSGRYANMVRDSVPASGAGDDAVQEVSVSASGVDGKLLDAVSEEMLYLDPYLSLESLAGKLHTNRTYLSSTIHACRNQNFSDYINSLRISHFVDIVKSGKYTSIKEAALNSGYNNLQSFYRHFSDTMRMTPKTWISKL